jgi:SAM-dependent methyltransferase
MTSPEEQIRAEAELARQLAEAPEHERRKLYGPAYDRIYKMHLSRAPDVLDFGADLRLMPLLLKLTEPGDCVLEIGCGTGLLAVELAKAERVVTAVDVSQVALDKARERAGGTTLTLERIDGAVLPFEDLSFAFAYSVEGLEHKHPDDVFEHLREVRRTVRHGGHYWFLTPSGLASSTAGERFGVEAETETDADVHLKEWTYTELQRALRDAGWWNAKVPLRDYEHLWWPRLSLGTAAWLERHVPPGRLFDRLGLGRCSVVARAY